MALGKCPECGHDMSTEAEQCPNCGWRPPNKRHESFGQTLMDCGTVLTIFVTVPILILCGIAFFGF